MRKNNIAMLWLSLLLIATTNNAAADSCSDYANALNSCSELVVQLQNESKILKDTVAATRKERDEAVDAYKTAVNAQPLLPWYAYVGIGFLAGYVAVQLH